ncbi:transmembrane protein 232 isoform X1 [Pleurodeles waltl]
MPIIKVPPVHKFGIISQRRHQDFQQKYLEIATDRPCEEPRKPPEVTEEFINQFNAAKKPEEREHFLDLAEKFIIRSKRRAGYSCMGSGEYVDLPKAWTELILLAQCKGKIQEDALDVLLASLDHAPLEAEQCPVLFFLAESVLYRICCDAIQKPYLYSSEVKLSKLGSLTLLRLYWFHMSGQLSCPDDNKKRLYTYLQAIPACEETYQPYPNVLSALHLMLKAGEMVCGALVTRNSHIENKECTLMEGSSIGKSEPSSIRSVKSKDEGTESGMSRLLWHSLLAWFCVRSSSPNLDDVLRHLPAFKEELFNDNWLDSILALFVLGEAAKVNACCLQVLLDLMGAVIPNTDFLQSQGDDCLPDLTSWPWEIIYFYSSVLADICVSAHTSEIQKYALIGFNNESSSTIYNNEAQDTSLCGLLRHRIPSFNKSDPLFWTIRYSGLYNLVKVCNHLRGDVNREGLRNAAWKAIHKQESNEEDFRVLAAVKVAEAEINGPANPFISPSDRPPLTPCCSQHVGWRLTNGLSKLFLPPIVPHIRLPKIPVPRPTPTDRSKTKKDSKEKKEPRTSLRQEMVPPAAASTPSRDRADVYLRMILESQWIRHTEIQMKQEEELWKKELLEKQRKEDERFIEIMKQREEKLKKGTKPYELLAATYTEKKLEL